MKDSRIGENCVIGQNVLVSPNVTLGNRVKVQNNVSLYTGVVCEDDVFLGPSCVFTNVNNPRSFIERKNEFRPTVIRRGASVGANATIVCGHIVGQYAFIGAGSVVTKDVPDFAFVYGVPAVLRGYVCRCAEKLAFVNERAECLICGAKYRIEDGTVCEE